VPSNLVISKLGPDSDVILRNLFEFYMHDMAEWFDLDTKADGSYSYDTRDVWKNGHDAYLAKLGDSIAGFALVGSAAEWLNDTTAHDVHEFFVIRRFRRRGLGQKIATLPENSNAPLGRTSRCLAGPSPPSQRAGRPLLANRNF